jgi:hypothetical protein
MGILRLLFGDQANSLVGLSFQIVSKGKNGGNSFNQELLPVCKRLTPLPQYSNSGKASCVAMTLEVCGDCVERLGIAGMQSEYLYL